MCARVLVATNMYPTEAEPWRGAFVADQVHDLRESGVDVELFTFDGRQRWRAYLEAVPRLRAAVEGRGFDLVHAHYGLTGAVGACQSRAPLVTTFHGSDLNIPWQRRCSALAARRGAVIFQSARDTALVRHARAAVIPCGTDLVQFAPQSRASARARLGWGHAPTVLLPGSRRRSVKRADLFDSAVRIASEAVPRLRCESLENLPRERVADALNAADVVMVTSDWEGSPMVVREALACLTPVVSVDAGDVRQVLSGMPSCHVVERRPEALASALVRTLGAERHPAWRGRAAEYSRAFVLQKLLSLYADVLA
jgi:glycosyltransferase involved in cell wall biosynthesis